MPPALRRRRFRSGVGVAAGGDQQTLPLRLGQQLLGLFEEFDGHLGRLFAGLVGSDPIERGHAYFANSFCIVERPDAPIVRRRIDPVRWLKLQGKTPGPEASIQKVMADEHGQGGVEKDDAEAAKAKLEEVGADVEVK